MKPSKSILTKLTKYFPQVKHVNDAKESIYVSVTAKDSASGRKKDAANCALAKACVREGKADGALIRIGFSYIIKGDTATRYKTSAGIGREIVSFDRHQDFHAGNDYVLSKVSPSNRLRVEKRTGRTGPKNQPKERVYKHHTENIRTSK